LGFWGVEINQLNCTLERTIGVAGAGRRKRSSGTGAAVKAEAFYMARWVFVFLIGSSR
jgi:hypothetical protein